MSLEGNNTCKHWTVQLNVKEKLSSSWLLLFHINLTWEFVFLVSQLLENGTCYSGSWSTSRLPISYCSEGKMSDTSKRVSGQGLPRHSPSCISPFQLHSTGEEGTILLQGPQVQIKDSLISCRNKLKLTSIVAITSWLRKITPLVPENNLA